MDADVVIVGGGLAGLAAAQRLSSAGRSVLLLEARPWLGGRVRTHWLQDFSWPVELGAEWIPNAGEIPDLLRSAGAPLEQAAGDRLVRQDGTLQNMGDLPDIAGSLERRIGELAGNDRSLAQALAECCGEERDREARALLLNYVEGFHAADPSRLSTHWLLTVERNEPADAAETRTREGTERIVELLQAGSGARCRYRTECVVREIRWQDGGVEIAAEHQGSEVIFRGRRAVVTVPLPLLRAGPGTPGAIRFLPGLEGKRAALEKLAMGPACKLVLRFREPFWEQEPVLREMVFLHAFGAPFPTWWTLRPAHVPLLSAWSAGPQVTALSGRTGEALVDPALTSLASASGIPRRIIEDQLAGWHYHDWNADPYSRGAYTYVTVGGQDAYRTLAEPLAGTLFFAGEATCGEGLNATMEGAVRSGRRAAAELLGQPR